MASTGSTGSTRLLVAPAALRAGEVEITGDDHHYLFRVRRLRPGDVVTLFDGAGRQSAAAVDRIEAERAILIAEPPIAEPAASSWRLAIAVALIKGERMEWCLQKLTEVGADDIVVMHTARTVVRLDGDRATSRISRWTAVAIDAARQSHRATVPTISIAPSFEAALATLATAPLRLIAHPLAADDLAAAIAAARPAAPRTAALAIGPEGGFAPTELDLALSLGWSPISLGPHILRAETAAIIGAAQLSQGGRS
jgi:16S rRNA (uracil1498-N3)-methyltransferase